MPRPSPTALALLALLAAPPAPAEGLPETAAVQRPDGEDAVSEEGALAWWAAIAPYDEQRLYQEEQSFAVAIRSALAGGSAEDIATLVAVLSEPPREFAPEELLGDWRCRTIKLGDQAGGASGVALVVYRDFACRIDPHADGLALVKTSGSQRLTGVIYPDSPAMMVFLGAGHYADEQPRPYGGPGNPLFGDPENRDMVAIVTMHGDRALLGFPAPILESDYDILELRRP